MEEMATSYHMTVVKGAFIVGYIGPEFKTKKDNAILDRAMKYQSDQFTCCVKHHGTGIEIKMIFREFDKNGEPKFKNKRSKNAAMKLLSLVGNKFNKAIAKLVGN